MSHQQPIVDLLVIGGGINGAGIAADAAGRGLSVMLCEMNDLASATSSSSSKLIHGGLRYLEHYEFRLVREALAEREVLLKKAPHIIWPLRFLLPHQPHLRPAWMIRAGLFLYDHLATRTTLGASESVDFGVDSPLLPAMTQGFEYSDGWVDDARLVVLNAMAAQHAGATIRTHTRCVNTSRSDNLWKATLQDTSKSKTETIQARMLVNATGPWVSRFFPDVMQLPAPKRLRLVKGSHIIVPRLHAGPEAYILQNEDERIVFVIPYEEKYSLIGTTDVEYEGDPATVTISQDEVDYLIAVTNEHFKNPIKTTDIIWSYSGVRPLLDDDASDSAQAVSRDYTFEIDAPVNGAPLLSVFGGKITTYRKLAEAAVNQLCALRLSRGDGVSSGPAWTADAALPGGDFKDHSALSNELRLRYPWLPVKLRTRYVRTYGTLTHTLLIMASTIEDLGTHFSPDLYAVEVDYLIKHEWAVTVDDIIWRRTKLGLRLNKAAIKQLSEYLSERVSC